MIGSVEVQSKPYSDGLTSTVTYSYDNTAASCDGLGRLASVTSGTVVNNYSCYDPIGRVATAGERRPVM
jgi:hypothetical protein